MSLTRCMETGVRHWHKSSCAWKESGNATHTWWIDDIPRVKGAR
jgi:hypothetical protein